MNLRTVVAEDHAESREWLLKLLSAEADVTVVGCAATGLEALQLVRRLTPDLALLDIEMPGLPGPAIVKALGHDAMPAIVFVTAHEKYAVQAFELHAVDYLIKPFSRVRLHETLQRVRRRKTLEKAEDAAGRLLKLADELRDDESGNGRIAVRSPGRLVFVPRLAVEWLEADGDSVRIHTRDGTHTTRSTLHRVLQETGLEGFCRVHRSYAVNLQRVRELRNGVSGDYELLLESGSTVPVSRAYRASLVERLASQS